MARNANICTLNINGTEINDFKAVTLDAVTYWAKVVTMQGIRHRRTIPAYAGKIDYIVPVTGKFDFEGVEDARLTVREEGGNTYTYTGVYLTVVGESKYDSENDNIQEMAWSAEDRVKE